MEQQFKTKIVQIVMRTIEDILSIERLRKLSYFCKLIRLFFN